MTYGAAILIGFGTGLVLASFLQPRRIQRVLDVGLTPREFFFLAWPTALGSLMLGYGLAMAIM